MPRYRIHRIRDAAREQFRWQAHTGGTATTKPKDYEPGVERESDSPYALWTQMKTEEAPLVPGDILETVKEDTVPGDLQIFKYIGFEPAKWWVAEPKPDFKGKPEDLAPPQSAAAVQDAVSG